MAYITCEDVSLGYDGSVITRDIHFQVNKGDYLYIVGENGVGKSTLIKTILQLMEPVSGRILMGDRLKSNEIGYLPQQTNVQKDFPASVWEIVLSGTLNQCGGRPFYKKEEKQLAESKMRLMNIWELRGKCYRKLSGGQQQRVLLARALCATSKIVLLDEPVTGLDPKATTEFYQQLLHLNATGIAIIMVSHDIKAATTYASHILHIGKKQLFYGTRQEYTKSSVYQMFLQAGGEELE